jgi:hypothetical protein
MKNLFAGAAGIERLAARAVSPLNISFDQVAPDTAPHVESFLGGLSPAPTRGMHI